MNSYLGSFHKCEWFTVGWVRWVYARFSWVTAKHTCYRIGYFWTFHYHLSNPIMDLSPSSKYQVLKTANFAPPVVVPQKDWGGV